MKIIGYALAVYVFVAGLIFAGAAVAEAYLVYRFISADQKTQTSLATSDKLRLMDAASLEPSLENATLGLKLIDRLKGEDGSDTAF